MNIFSYLYIAGGLALLFGGGEMLIKGAARLAVSAGITPLFVGLTVVAFSTSAPELAVSLQAVRAGQADLALGNVIGSNISNVLLILGASALLAPLVVVQKLIRVDVPLMIGTSLVLWLMAADRTIARWEGILLITGIVAYTFFAIRSSRHETAAVKAEYQQEYGTQQKSMWRDRVLDLGLMAGGVGFLVAGSNWLVAGATDIADALGLSELIIGLTIIAVGTSLPELVTSLMATVRGERDIAVGNVIGSNLFNILSVLGLTSTLSPHGINVPAAALNFDIPVMVFVSMACLPIFFNGNRIARWEGAFFLGYYVIYVTYLVLASAQHAALSFFSAVLLWFIVPLTVLTIGIITVREFRHQQAAGKRRRS